MNEGMSSMAPPWERRKKGGFSKSEAGQKKEKTRLCFSPLICATSRATSSTNKGIWKGDWIPR